MIEDILYRISDLVPSGAEFGNMSSQDLPLAIVSCILGAFVLTRFTGSLGSITVPVNYSALFIGVTVSNWALRGLDLPVDKMVAQPVLIALIGIHIYLVTRLGVQSPPWSSEAAGRERAPVEPTGARAGLVRGSGGD